jgi:hypothetical protein
MIIEITDTATIADVQDKFSTIFPFLKVEFFQHSHRWYEKAPLEKALPSNKKLGEIRKQHPHGRLDFFSWYSIEDIELVFRKKFNLNAQVFCLQGNKWVQTNGNGKLTLKEQNEIGRHITLESFSNSFSKIAGDNLI